MSETITASEAGRVLGVHRTEVSRRSQPGGVLEHAVVTPARGRRAARYSRRAIEVYAAALREQRPLDPQHERARKDRAAADLAELRLHVERGDYLPREEVERQQTAEAAALKAKLLSWSSTMTDVLYRAATVEGLAGFERRIERAVHEVLGEFADPERPIACPHCGRDMGEVPEHEREPRCRAMTSKGVRCKNAAEDDGYCHIRSHKAVA